MRLHQNVGLALLTATLTALTVTACGDDAVQETGCKVDADCQAGELCHPTAKVCATTCETANDCDDSAKNCDAFPGLTQKICQCSTTALCNGETSDGGAVCSDTHQVCLTSCANGQACPDGLTCSDGECVGTGGSGKTCDADAAQPAGCESGEFCASDSCQAVPAATCANFTTGQGTNADTGTTGPIIYSVEQEGGTTAQATCTDFSVRVKAYRTVGTFGTTGTALAQEFRILGPAGNSIAADTVINPGSIAVSADGKNVEFLVGMCGTGTDGEYSFGAYFTEGNAACGDVEL